MLRPFANAVFKIENPLFSEVQAVDKMGPGVRVLLRGKWKNDDDRLPEEFPIIIYGRRPVSRDRRILFFGVIYQTSTSVFIPAFHWKGFLVEWNSKKDVATLRLRSEAEIRKTAGLKLIPVLHEGLVRV